MKKKADSRITDSNKYEMKAFSISKEILISTIEEQIPYRILSKTRSEALVELHKNSFCFVYGFGSIVFFNAGQREQLEILSKIKHNGSTLAKFEMDEYDIIIDPKRGDFIDFNEAKLKNIDSEKLKMISQVLAQSVSLETLEDSVDEKLKIIDKVNLHLKKGTKFKIIKKC